MLAGKSAIADLLEINAGYVIVRARDVLRSLAGGGLETRADLQRFGAQTEEETNGGWLARAVETAAELSPEQPIVVDAARTLNQVLCVREVLDDLRQVHLTAPRDVLKQRFGRATKDMVEPATFEKAMTHEVERHTQELERFADIVLDSSSDTPEVLLGKLQTELDRV
jgi:predicted kinase